MPHYHAPESHIHVIARAVLLCGDDVVLCKIKGKDQYFLPGGHIEDGESAVAALKRELHEELNLTAYSAPEFLAVCENIFDYSDSERQHEINLVFKVKLPSDSVITTDETHIEFVKVSREDIKNLNILSLAMKNELVKWINGEGVHFIKM